MSKNIHKNFKEYAKDYPFVPSCKREVKLQVLVKKTSRSINYYKRMT